MSFEALQLYKVKLQPGRHSIFCWALHILIVLPITYMFSQSQFLTQIPFFFPSETQPANFRNHLRGFLPKPSWLLPAHTAIPTHFLFHLCSWMSHITIPHPNLYTETPASLSCTSSNSFYSVISFPLGPRFHLAHSSLVSPHMFLILLSSLSWLPFMISLSIPFLSLSL